MLITVSEITPLDFKVLDYDRRAIKITSDNIVDVYEFFKPSLEYHDGYLILDLDIPLKPGEWLVISEHELARLEEWQIKLFFPRVLDE